jgi:dGTPase
LEKGSGLNLTFEVRDGILNHTGPNRPRTLEGQIVKIADRVAYINHDIDDAVRGGIITAEQLPEECLLVLGNENRVRINNMILDLINNNGASEHISMSAGFQTATDLLRKFLFTHVYVGSDAKREESKARHVIKSLFELFMEEESQLHDEYPHFRNSEDKERIVCDYIAGMTDRYAIRSYQKYFLPVPWVE